jgi:hypothetical protein
MAGKTPVPQDPEDERNDLLATLAAARELGPDMDKALAESYLQRQQQTSPKTPAPATVSAAPAQSATPSMPWPMYFTPALGIIAYIALLVVSGGHLWWTFWLIPAFSGWGWWGGHRGAHYQRRVEREQWRRARWEARYGEGYGQSQPQPSAPPEVPSPQQPQQPPQPQKTPPPIEYD